jgi:hypothetical protein
MKDRIEQSIGPELSVILKEEFGLKRATAAVPIAGGRNSKVWRIECGAEKFLLKQYHPSGTWDRMAREYGFLELLWGGGIRSIPRPVQRSSRSSAALYGWRDGRKLHLDEIGDKEIREAADFVIAINRMSQAHRFVGVAAEGCGSLDEHIARIELRVQRVREIRGSGIYSEARKFVDRQLVPAWEIVRDRAFGNGEEFRAFTTGIQILSPSDFGFHNVLRAPGGELAFIDFEYSGWDDPGKLVSDFYCQPELPVPRDSLELFSDLLQTLLPHTYKLSQYVKKILLPLYEVKWCCILLNEFLGKDSERRRFSSGHPLSQEILKNQLEKARTAHSTWQERI